MTDRVFGIDIEHFRERVIQDAFAEATFAYWNRRADSFEAARRRPGDYTGMALPTEITERDAELGAIAEACRARASLSIGADLLRTSAILDAIADADAA